MGIIKIASVLVAVLTISVSTFAQNLQFCAPDKVRALALSGGGAKGAFEVGALWHLVRHRKCDFHDISGVSVGALNGAILAQAPRASDPQESLANISLAIEKLRSFWLDLRGDEDVYTRRFLGTLGFVLFSRKSMYDSSPLKDKLTHAVDPSEIAAKGRSFRVGIVSMRNGVYYEVQPGTGAASRECRANRNEKFLAAVLASASMPVFFPTPFIRNVQDMSSCAKDVSEEETDEFEPFADGGVSHTTPVPAYFNQPYFVPRLKFNSIQATRDDGSADLPRHQPPIHELFVLLASPYSPKTANPPGSGQHIKNLPGGTGLLAVTVERVLTAPWRWDMNYALMANGLLTWKDNVLGEVEDNLRTASADTQEILGPIRDHLLPPPGLLNAETSFPVGSANVDGQNIPHHYSLYYAAFNREGIDIDTLKFDPALIAKAIKSGCDQQNRALVENGWQDMGEQCADVLPAAAQDH